MWVGEGSRWAGDIAGQWCSIDQLIWNTCGTTCPTRCPRPQIHISGLDQTRLRLPLTRGADRDGHADPRRPASACRPEPLNRKRVTDQPGAPPRLAPHDLPCVRRRQCRPPRVVREGRGPTAARTRTAFVRPVTSVMVWFAPRRLPGRPSSPKGRSAIAARRPAAALDPGASATLTVPRTRQAKGPARHDAPREPHHHSERSDTTSPTCSLTVHLRDHFVDKHAANTLHHALQRQEAPENDPRKQQEGR